MGFMDRFRRLTSAGGAAPSPEPVGVGTAHPAVQPDSPARARPASGVTPARPIDEMDEALEAALWERLREDPNNPEDFDRLADVLRRHALKGQADTDPQRAANDAVWSLAEELAHSPKAWYPLVELARLSVHEDREGALRRLGTATERDPGGTALATALVMLRQERLPGDAVNLATGHWRPREHTLEAGRQVVEAATEAGRVGDARRMLAALAGHPDAEGVERIRDELAPLIDRAEAQLPPGTPAGGIPIIDLGELRAASHRNPFRRSRD